MKNGFSKLMICLLAVVMVVSCMTMAMAATQVDCYEMEMKSDGRRARVNVQDLAEGDVLSFYVKAVPGSGIDGIEQLKIYVRNGSSDEAVYLDAEGNDTGVDVEGLWLGEEGGKLWGNGDYWFYIVCKITKAGDNEISVVTYDEGESSTFADAQVGKCYVAGIKINGVAVDPSKVVGYDSGNVCAKTTINEPQPTDDNEPDYVRPEDSTTDVEPTGDAGNTGDTGNNTGYTKETFTGTLPTYDPTPYTWKVNATLGGAQNLPAVNLAASGRYSDITNVNDELFKAMMNTTFVDVNNMIFIIGDGMGQNDITLSEHYEGNLIMNNMPFYGQSATDSYDLETGSKWVTTDSAAGGTALGSGIKTRYSYQGLDKDGNDAQQITEALREKLGKIIGVVTTDRGYDATPATFGGAHSIRDNTSETVKEMMTFAPDLWIGYALNNYKSTYNSLMKNELAGQDIGFYDNWSKAVVATHDKMFISFSSDLTYKDNFSTSKPTISQLMAYSLTWLQAKSDANNNVGFFMMFENGMTDDAGHDNDREWMIREVQATDEATAIAIKFACENPDTMVIVTADHDTGGMKLNKGWETNIKKAKFTSSNHSSQDVAVYVLGKGGELFDGQTMYNAQVSKLSAYLMGLDTFGSTDPEYDIADLIAGKKNEIEPPVQDNESLIKDNRLSVKATADTTKMSFTIGDLNAKAHDMVMVAIKVPAGATNLKLYAADSFTQATLREALLDKEQNYDANFDYYVVTVKGVEDYTKLGFEVTGNFKAGDEVWVDYLIVASTIYNFDEYDIANATAGENVTVSITASDDINGANDSTADAKDDADDKKFPLWIIAVVDVVVVAAVVVVVVLKKKK